MLNSVLTKRPEIRRTKKDGIIKPLMPSPEDFKGSNLGHHIVLIFTSDLTLNNVMKVHDEVMKNK